MWVSVSRMMMLFDSPSFHKHPTAIETMHHSKPECLMFAFPSRYSTANGYSNKKQAVFYRCAKRPLPAEVVIIPLLKVLILHCTGYHIEWPTCWCHSSGKRTHCALLLGELGFGLWNLGWSKLKDFCWTCFLQGDHWLFSNHCFCIRYRNIFKDPKGIIFLHGQECFIMTCHCHHQKQKLLQIASQWWLQSLVTRSQGELQWTKGGFIK